MSDKRLFLFLIILLLFAWSSIFPTLTQTSMTQIVRKENCSSEIISSSFGKVLYLSNKI